MTRRELLKSMGCVAGAGAVGPAWMPGQTVARKPNIIFVLADDLGINGLGCYGADRYQTPNIDKLAREGTRFTRAYTAPLCGPSRALIMTGRYAFRTGATNQDATGQMKPSLETMMPTYLKPSGYKTALVGKWGQLPLGPAEFGFDEYLKFKGSGVYWNTQAGGKTYTVNGVAKGLRDGEYLPDVMHDFMIDFITRHRNDPFYVYYSMSHVHGEIQASPQSKPDSKPGSQDQYADNIAYMDKLVGKLVAELERLKLRENTLIVFVGDNGTGGGYAKQSTIGGRQITGQKGSMLEGGANVPMIVNWPGKTPAGRVLDDLVDSTDFVPTFAEIAGGKMPAGKILDGHSFAPQIYGQMGQAREWIFIQLARNWYVREKDWKLNEAGELFDMRLAPFGEPLVPADTKDASAMAARRRLQAALEKLNPAGGFQDEGDGTGRHANREENRKKKRAKGK